MTSYLTPSKRPYERNPVEFNGKGKWKKTARVSAQPNQQKAQAKATVFRILCPASKCGSLIGKGGSVVEKIRQETGVRIKLDDPVSGCDERVVTITVSDKDATPGSEHNLELDRSEQMEEGVASEQNKENIFREQNKEEERDSKQNMEEKLGSEQNKVEEHGSEQNKEEEHDSQQNKKEEHGSEQNSEEVGYEHDKEDSGVQENKGVNDDQKVEKNIEDGDVSASATNDDQLHSEDKDQIDEPLTTVDIKFEKSTPAALKALLLVFDRIVSTEESAGADEASEGSSNASSRLLVLSNQVGCLLGRGGSVIKQMSTDSGSHIRILSRDQVPLCASANEEVVQITGSTVDAVRKALQLVGQQLLENSSRDSSMSSYEQLASNQKTDFLAAPKFKFSNQGPSFSGRSIDFPDFHPNNGPLLNFSDPFLPGQTQMHPESLTFKLLCNNQKVGTVIGKGGNVIKTIQNETGSEIRIMEIASEPDDRIIAITGPALPGDRISPAEDGVLLVQQRLAGKDTSVVCQMLVSTNQTGCILGKGGSIIAEMRKLSGAYIRVIGKDLLPEGLPEGDEVVQIKGEPEVVQEALMQVTTRLRHHFFRNKVPKNPSVHPAFSALELPPSRLHTHFPPLKREGGLSFEDRSAFGHGVHGPAHPFGAERVPWAPLGIREDGPLSAPEFSGGFHRKLGHRSGPTQPAIAPEINVDVVVPRLLVPALYGEDGGCLRRIREISEAKITITEPRPEATETVILITGVPDQTYAAQSLLQAFVLSEKEPHD